MDRKFEFKNGTIELSDIEMRWVAYCVAIGDYMDDLSMKYGDMFNGDQMNTIAVRAYNYSAINDIGKDTALIKAVNEFVNNK